MGDTLKDAIDDEIERSHNSGIALVLGDSAKRVVSAIGGSGPAINAMVERQLIREASYRSIPIMLDSTSRKGM